MHSWNADLEGEHTRAEASSIQGLQYELIDTDGAIIIKPVGADNRDCMRVFSKARLVSFDAVPVEDYDN